MSLNDIIVINALWNIVKTWYWLFLPFIIWPFFKLAWLWQRRMKWEARQDYVFLEITFPRAPEEPMTSMEQIFSNWWSIYSNLHGAKNFRKKWLKGRRHYHMTIEIVSIGPYPHVYLRVNKHHVDTVRASFYSQYPTAEINVVDDFSSKIPWNLPDNEYNTYAFDEILLKPEVYPIKTYRRFFEERPEQMREEKRVDPLGTLLEGFAELKKGEILWIQFRIAPMTPKDKSYMKIGEKIVNKLLHRDEEKKDDDSFVPVEMKLSPKEKKNVHAIEDKLGENVFDCNIRCLYIGDRDIYHPKRRTLAEQYFSSFNTQDLNAMKRWSRTKSKIRHFIIKKRLYRRNRRMQRWFFMREPTYFPSKAANYILSTEELATMFHPPIGLDQLGSYLPRVSVRKGEAQTNLPTEEEEKEYSLEKKKKKGQAPQDLPT